MSEARESWLAAEAAGLRLALRVTPRARRAGIAGIGRGRHGEPRLKVTVTAAPEAGAANAAVLALLADATRLPKSAFALVAGATDRDKVVRVSGAPADLAPRFAALAEAGS